MEVNRCRTSPTALGRRPLLQGKRVAPQRWETTLLGMVPEQNKLTSLVRLYKAWNALSEDGQKTACFRWLAHRPGAEPLGKDLRAIVTSSTETRMAMGRGSAGRVGPSEAGCLESISSKTSSQGWASPAEVRELSCTAHPH